MKPEHFEIVELISMYLAENPSQRFGQALFNLGINEFPKNSKPEDSGLRDIHADKDTAIQGRIKDRLKWFEDQKKN